MAKLTLEELRKIREENKKLISKRDVENKNTVILVGMGTCGIAAGARETLQAFVDEIDKMGLKDIIVKPTGCMGACYVEPTVEVSTPDMPTVLYGKVTPEIARKILDHHVLHKRLVNEHIYDKPSADIIK